MSTFLTNIVFHQSQAINKCADLSSTHPHLSITDQYGRENTHFTVELVINMTCWGINVHANFFLMHTQCL